MGKLKRLLGELPWVNRCVLMFLVKGLREVAGEVGVNKMSAHNLAIVFAPNLLKVFPPPPFFPKNYSFSPLSFSPKLPLQMTCQRGQPL